MEMNNLNKSANSKAGGMSMEVKLVNNQPDNDDIIEREQWTGKLDFIMSCIGYAIGKILIMYLNYK